MRIYAGQNLAYAGDKRIDLEYALLTAVALAWYARHIMESSSDVTHPNKLVQGRVWFNSNSM